MMGHLALQTFTCMLLGTHQYYFSVCTNVAIYTTDYKPLCLYGPFWGAWRCSLPLPPLDQTLVVQADFITTTSRPNGGGACWLHYCHLSAKHWWCMLTSSQSPLDQKFVVRADFKVSVCLALQLGHYGFYYAFLVHAHSVVTWCPGWQSISHLVASNSWM